MSFATCALSKRRKIGGERERERERERDRKKIKIINNRIERPRGKQQHTSHTQPLRHHHRHRRCSSVKALLHGLRQCGYITGFKPLWNRSSHRAEPRETGDGHREKYPSRFCPRFSLAWSGPEHRSPSRKKSLLSTRAAYFSTVSKSNGCPH